MRKITALASGILILASPLFAQTPPAPDDDSTDWTTDMVSPPPKPGNPAPAPTTPEGGFSNSERIRFGEDMRSHVLDQICRNAQIPLGHNFALTDFGAVGVEGVRRLRVLPDNRVAIQDSQTVKLDLGHALLTDTLKDGSVFGIGVSAHFDGTSFVLRPMPTTESCSEIWRLLKVTDSKSIVPFKAQRLEDMMVGELWKLPAVLTIGHAESLSHGLTEANGAAFVPVVSFGIGQSGAAMMTVFRMSEDKMRFRFRISHARIHNQSGAISAVYPAVALFAAPHAILLKVVESAITHQLEHYFHDDMGLFFTQSDGQQLLMEFILDPKNPQDMEDLAKVLRGDFVTLLKMAQRMVNLQATEQRAQRDFRDLEKQQEAAFHRPANFPGMDINHTDSRNLHLMLPFLFDHQRVNSMADDRIVRLDPQGGEVRIYRSDKNINTGMFEVPIKGQLVKHNRQASAQAFVFRDKDGKTTEPQAVYIKQEGFLRDSSEDVRRMAQDVNGIMSLVGAKGGAPNPRLQLPVDKILPPEPPTVTHAAHGQEQTTYPTYHDGNVAFTMVLNEKAVASILNASAELVARCFTNTLDGTDKTIMKWVLANGKVNADGYVDYDYNAMRNAIDGPFAGQDGIRPNSDSARGLTKAVERIVHDLEDARLAPTAEERAQAVVKLMSGRGESDLAYGDIMKVLVQMVDPLDVTADLVMNVSKDIKGNPDLHAHMLVKKNRPDNPGLKAAGEAKNRFAQPSELVD